MATGFGHPRPTRPGSRRTRGRGAPWGRSMGYLVVGCRVLVGTVFAIAVVGKIRGTVPLRAFVRSLGDLASVPRRLRPVVAAAVLLCEAAVPVLLALPGVGEPCRCFGAGAAPLSRAQVVRNGLLTTIAAAGLAAALRWPAPSAPGAGAAAAGIALAALAGVIAATVLIRLDDIVALFAPSAPQLVPTGSRRAAPERSI